jgi:hypothetical protein
MRIPMVLSSFVILFAGCGGLQEFPIAETTGTVLCDGKPVAKALVYFVPKKTANDSFVGKQGYALTDENGRFTVSTYKENDGAVVGKHVVRVGNSETTSKCDCALVADVPLTEVDVKANEKNNFELVLKKPEGDLENRVDRRQRDEQLEIEMDKD